MFFLKILFEDLENSLKREHIRTLFLERLAWSDKGSHRVDQSRDFLSFLSETKPREVHEITRQRA